jgi:hypothetical protein
MHIIVQCEKCQISMPQGGFATRHNSTKCLEMQLANKNSTITELEARMKHMKGRLDYYEYVMEKIIKGENLQLNI